MLGLAIGSVFAGSITYKVGLKRSIILFNLFSLIGTCLKLVENYPVILIGRLIYGVAGGVLVFGMGKALNDTVPPEYAGIYGSMVNAGFCISISISNALAMLVPGYKEEPK